MSVVSVSELTLRRSGPSTELSGSEQATRVFVVQVSSGNDDGIVVRRATGLPRPHQPYSVGENSIGDLTVIKISPEKVDQFIWEVTIEYGTPDKQNKKGGGGNNNPQKNDPEQAVENPLDRPAIHSFSGGEIETFPWTDLRGKVFNNSAGQLFQDSPSITLGYEIITIARNEKNYNRKLYPPYNGAVNSDRVFGYPPGYALMKRISAQQQYETFTFFRVTYEIHGLPKGGLNWNDITGEVLDQGDYYVEKFDDDDGNEIRVYPSDSDKDKVISTVHLDGNGQRLPRRRVKVGDGEFINFHVLHRKPFARLNLE